MIKLLLNVSGIHTKIWIRPTDLCGMIFGYMHVDCSLFATLHLNGSTHFAFFRSKANYEISFSIIVTPLMSSSDSDEQAPIHLCFTVNPRSTNPWATGCMQGGHQWIKKKKKTGAKGQCIWCKNKLMEWFLRCWGAASCAGLSIVMVILVMLWEIMTI